MSDRACALACAGMLLAAAGCGDLRRDPDAVAVDIGGERFTLEVAADDASRARGLKGRLNIPPDGGMLFIFPEARVRSFWMADCLVDIDIMFLDPHGRVTATHEMTVEPPRRSDETRAQYEARLKGYGSVYPAQFAIELRAGTIRRLGIGVDSKVELDTQRLKALAR